ncbi:MAG: hypothetical protein AAF840_04365 [Bacteroidota bacterium]
MDPLKIYRWATWNLLALNVAILAFFLFFPPHPPGEGPGRGVRVLNFDPAQEEQFGELVQQHQAAMRQLNQQHQDLLKAYFSDLSAAQRGDTVPSLPNPLARIEQQKIIATYQHFLDVEGLLRPDQQANFPGFVEEALGNIFHQQPKRGKRREGKPRE